VRIDLPLQRTSRQAATYACGLRRRTSGGGYDACVRPDLGEESCRRFETGGSLSRRVSVPRAPAQMGRARGRARRGESEVAGDGHERGGNPAAFVFVPRPGRVRLQ
jgi:hypothetical protein